MPFGLKAHPILGQVCHLLQDSTMTNRAGYDLAAFFNAVQELRLGAGLDERFEYAGGDLNKTRFNSIHLRDLDNGYVISTTDPDHVISAVQVLMIVLFSRATWNDKREAWTHERFSHEEGVRKITVAASELARSRASRALGLMKRMRVVQDEPPRRPEMEPEVGEDQKRRSA